MDTINDLVGAANGILFSNYVVYALLATGLLFTIWSGFGQYRALTHGVAVVRGKYDEKGNPGAINHFQALSAALSATVGLGNIAGVSVAVGLGGPGAVFWMWVIGIIGMSLKMTEVTQSMLYRNTDDPENPHGGPMFVAREGFKRLGLGWLGSLVGGLFVVTLLISAITGGNMFQSWNVADVTFTYFKLPTAVTGIILAVLVGLVIIGGIKRIGSVAGRIVPAMCALYIAAALVVLAMNITEIPGMLALIVKHGLGLDAPAERAFIGGAFGYAALWGIKRALFSSEAGQGSAPIAHSAARTNEPVREGVVAGLEPFIDTLVVCTITALVIMSTGAWNRGHEAVLSAGARIVPTQAVAVTGLDAERPEAITELTGRMIETGNPDEITFFSNDTPPLHTFTRDRIDAVRTAELAGEDGTVDEATGVATLAGSWVIETERAIAPRNEEARTTSGIWEPGDSFFVLVDTGTVGDHGNTLSRLFGDVRLEDDGSEEGRRVFTWRPLDSENQPTLMLDTEETGNVFVYGDYAGASLTAHAFDRAIPGLGMWLVTIASWLFALSTMISWSYYGEQGIVYLGGKGTSILVYKFIYCALIVVSCLGFIKTDVQLDMWTTLGLGVMLVVNIPIMLIFGGQAMKAYHTYLGKLKRGEFVEHEAGDIVDIVEGHDEK
jgi:AGCS family alanine or glycine:cation symporter